MDARAYAFAVALAALANPLIVQETREPLPDVVALIVDHSPSMDIRGRRAEADKAAAQISKTLAGDKTLEIRAAEVTAAAPARTPARNCSQRLSSALADVPPDRVAGAIAITDGEVHDVPANGKPALAAPIQCADRRTARTSATASSPSSAPRAMPSWGNPRR